MIEETEYFLIERKISFRKMSNEEIYESNIRGDFKKKLIPILESVEIKRKK
jgi:hypothetical protein